MQDWEPGSPLSRWYCEASQKPPAEWAPLPEWPLASAGTAATHATSRQARNEAEKDFLGAESATRREARAEAAATAYEGSATSREARAVAQPEPEAEAEDSATSRKARAVVATTFKEMLEMERTVLGLAMAVGCDE